MKTLRFCLALFSLLVLVLGAAAQVQNGQFTGTVTDPSGAAIGGAKVTVTNLGTNLSVTTTTNQSGDYAVKELPVGAYKIAVEAKGFNAHDGAGFYYTQHEGDVDNLWYQSMSGSPARQVTHFTSDHIYAFAFSRDGRRVAFTRGNEKQDAVMLSNFR